MSLNCCSQCTVNFFPHDYTCIHTPSSNFILYRTVLMALTLLNLILIILLGVPCYKLYYFTNWGLFLTIFYFLWAFFEILFFKYYGQMHAIKSWKFTHLLLVPILISEIIITIIYWVLLFGKYYPDGHFSSALEFYSVFGVHGFPLLLLLIQFAVTNYGPWNWWPLLTETTILLAYLILNYFYSVSKIFSRILTKNFLIFYQLFLDVQIIYYIIDYQSYWTGIYIGAIIFLMFVSFAILRGFFLFFKEKDALARLSVNTQGDSQPEGTATTVNRIIKIAPSVNHYHQQSDVQGL